MKSASCQVSHAAGLTRNFRVINSPGVFSILPRMGYLSIAKLSPGVKFTKTHLGSWVERDTVRHCAKEHNVMTPVLRGFSVFCLAYWHVWIPYRFSLNWHQSAFAVAPSGLILLITTSSPVSSRFQCLADILYHHDSKKKVVLSLLKIYFTTMFLWSWLNKICGEKESTTISICLNDVTFGIVGNRSTFVYFLVLFFILNQPMFL